jgi:hypothetical protein
MPSGQARHGNVKHKKSYLGSSNTPNRTEWLQYCPQLGAQHPNGGVVIGINIEHTIRPAIEPRAARREKQSLGPVASGQSRCI